MSIHFGLSTERGAADLCGCALLRPSADTQRSGAENQHTTLVLKIFWMLRGEFGYFGYFEGGRRALDERHGLGDGLAVLAYLEDGCKVEVKLGWDGTGRDGYLFDTSWDGGRY